MYPSAREIIEGFLNQGEKQALIYIDEDRESHYSVSYKDFTETILGLANFFYMDLGLKKGDTVSFVFENCPEVLAINLACFLTGLRACPLDSKRDTLDVALRKLKETKTKAFFYRNSDELTDKIVETANIISFKISDFADLRKLSKNPDIKILDKFVPNETSLILYTSGTTGFPKGAMLTFANLLSGSKQVTEWFEIKSDDNFYLVLPLHHINSTIFALSTILAHGKLVIPSRYSGSHFFSDCSKYQATMSSIVPTINLDLLEKEEEFEKYQNNLKLKRIQLGSAPVSPKHAKEFVEKYKIKLIQGYGSTETSLRVTGMPINLPEKLYFKLLEENSIGIALSENKVVILDKDDKIISTPSTEGEIGVSGNNIMLGYLDRPQETKQTLRNGFFHTGDLGLFKNIEGEKYYFLKGRSKEIIIKGGVNISPLFIEEKLREAFPWAKEVVVVGFSHYRYGEEVGAIFIPKERNYQKDFEKTLEDLKNNKVKNLDSFETPKAAIISDFESIPKTATGKVQHIKAKEVFEKKLQENYNEIARNDNFTFRLIPSDDELNLKNTVKITNSAFPKSLKLDLETLIHRANNGFVIGGFDKENNLEGALTGFFADEKLIDQSENWNEISGAGKFTTFNSKGKAAILASAASVSSSGKNENLDENILNNLNLTKKKVLEYINSKKDFVVKFHFTPKAGFKEGAKVKRIILNGNPKDLQSLGIVVLFEYPLLRDLKHKFTSNKVGVGLIEAAIKYAKDAGKEKVFPLSRLGEAYKYLKS